MPPSTSLRFIRSWAFDSGEQAIDFKGAKELMTLVPDFPIHIVDMARLQDETVFQTDLRTMVALFQKRNDKEAFKDYCDQCDEAYKLTGDGAMTLGELVESKELTKYCDMAMVKKESGKETVEVCRAITELIEDGRAEGRAEGRQEGREEGREEERKSTLREKARADAAEEESMRLKILLDKAGIAY